MSAKSIYLLFKVSIKRSIYAEYSKQKCLGSYNLLRKNSTKRSIVMALKNKCQVRISFSSKGSFTMIFHLRRFVPWICSHTNRYTLNTCSTAGKSTCFACSRSGSIPTSTVDHQTPTDTTLNSNHCI